MEVGLGFRGRQRAEVVGEVEIERIATDARDLHVLSAGTQPLQGCHDLEVNLGLIGADEDEYLEVISDQSIRKVGLYVLIVNQNEVRLHQILPLRRERSLVDARLGRRSRRLK